MLKHFYPRLFLMLTLGFALFVVIGTQLHELGHYSAGKILGYNMKLNYASVMPLPDPDSVQAYKKFHDSLYMLYPERFTNKEDTLLWNMIRAKSAHLYPPNNIWFTLGGPLQTMLTGTIALIFILVFYQRFRNRETLSLGQWTLIFFALFWLRQASNGIHGIVFYLINGKSSSSGDEYKLESMLDWPHPSIQLSTGLIGFAVLWFITFRVIPKNTRVTFMAAGLAGAAIGVYLWFFLIGPALLPDSYAISRK